jgi:tetratricopeptide (TPR) repeat protein
MKNAHVAIMAGIVALVAPRASATTVKCGSEQRETIDAKSIALQYSGTQLRAGVQALSKILGANFTLGEARLQEISSATQQWNEVFKALVAAYNGCALTQAQFDDALKNIYPRIERTASALTQAVSKGDDTLRDLPKLLKDLAGDYNRIVLLAGANNVEFRRVRSDLAAFNKAMLTQTARTNEELRQLRDSVNASNRLLTGLTLKTPAEADSELDRALNKQRDAAKAAYTRGFVLFDAGNLKGAAEEFGHAATLVPIAEFISAKASAELWSGSLAAAKKDCESALAMTSLTAASRAELLLILVQAEVMDATAHGGTPPDFRMRATSAFEQLIAEGPPATKVSAYYYITSVMATFAERPAEALDYAKKAITFEKAVPSPDHGLIVRTYLVMSGTDKQFVQAALDWALLHIKDAAPYLVLAETRYLAGLESDTPNEALEHVEGIIGRISMSDLSDDLKSAAIAVLRVTQCSIAEEGVTFCNQAEALLSDEAFGPLRSQIGIIRAVKLFDAERWGDGLVSWARALENDSDLLTGLREQAIEAFDEESVCDASDDSLNAALVLRNLQRLASVKNADVTALPGEAIRTSIIEEAIFMSSDDSSDDDEKALARLQSPAEINKLLKKLKYSLEEIEAPVAAPRIRALLQSAMPKCDDGVAQEALMQAIKRHTR